MQKIARKFQYVMYPQFGVIYPDLWDSINQAGYPICFVKRLLFFGLNSWNVQIKLSDDYNFFHSVFFDFISISFF